MASIAKLKTLSRCWRETFTCSPSHSQCWLWENENFLWLIICIFFPIYLRSRSHKACMYILIKSSSLLLFTQDSLNLFNFTDSEDFIKLLLSLKSLLKMSIGFFLAYMFSPVFNQNVLGYRSHLKLPKWTRKKISFWHLCIMYSSRGILCAQCTFPTTREEILQK